MDWHKLIVCGALLSVFSSLHAEDSQDEKAKEDGHLERKEERHKEEKKYLEGKIANLENSYIPSLKNAMQIWINLDLLYWVTKNRSMAYSTNTSNVLVTENFTTKSLVHTNFEWQPGFQVGVGYLFPKSHWDITFKGLHYHSATDGGKSTHDNPLLGMFPIWSLSNDILTGDYVTDAQMKGKLTFDRLLFQAGYFFQSSDRFVVRTWVGIESSFLKQGYHVEYSGGIFSSGTDYIHMQNNFWGTGPQVGIYPWILLGKGFSLFGKASASWLYGVFKIDQKETYLGVDRYDKNHSSVKGRWAADAEAGIQWKHPFYHDRFSFATKISWEYLVYFDQNQLKKDSYNKLQGGGVQMQGGVLSFIFDF